ncbi:MAG: 4Fe-4S dicluster domain-containing protein [Bacillota bacterium]
MQKYVLLIDHEACWGCMTCEVACKQENKAPDGVKLIYVTEDGPKESAGKLNFLYRVNNCRHCENPFCAEACPVEAISKRDDGIVIMDNETCTGCEACLEACPYHAIAFDKELRISRKCNLCYQRVDYGLIPACADNVCPAHCIYFGDPGEIEKVMAQKRKARNTKSDCITPEQ